MNIEEDIINRAGKRMADEIDFQILADMLCELDAWTAKHIKGPVENMGLVWIFEQEEDANWFALRWL